MDHLYGYFNNYASAKINLKQYFTEYVNRIQSNISSLSPMSNEKDILTMMDAPLGDEEYSMLSDYCSTDNLTVDGELPKMSHIRKLRRRDIFNPQKPADANLQTLQFLKTRLALKQRIYQSKHKNELIINHKPVEQNGELINPREEILVAVRVYYPFMNRIKYETVTQMGSKLVLHNVFVILGSQTLADLKDKINCVADRSISTECSKNPNKASHIMAKDVYKSGFFYIEDTFYNDTREPSNIDYSKVIIEWAKRRPKFGPFKVDCMETCRIDSLRLRFGYPWVYKHQGNCEHVICFSDARLMSIDDELVRSEYPRIIKVKPKYTKLCMICGVHAARWITMEHERIPHNPSFFCDLCFKSYNYVNGTKIGNFLAYPYPQDYERVKDLKKL